ncbi:MAG: hypothetical protein CH6_2371 [Candidatus Kapaibacterium sp.]|nr:MAG: hypothetical protein CH6_2371 [Candidatus Kapabacteria bacterium]
MSGNLKELFAKKTLPQVITLFGEEDFFVFEAYGNIVKKFTNDFPDALVEVFDVDEVRSKEDFIDILEKTIQPSFFSSNKLFVFKNIEAIFSKKSKKDKAEPHEVLFSKVILNPPEGNFYIFITFESSMFGISKKWQKDKKALDLVKFPFDLLLGKHYWIEFPKVYENQIRAWVIQRIKEKNYLADPEVIDFFLANTNPNLWEINTELEKIFAYLGERKKLTIDDLLTVLTGNRDINIFEITSLVAQRKVAESIVFINKVLNVYRQELLILSVLLKFFRNLLVLSELSKQKLDNSQLAKAIGVSPFFMNDYLIGLKNYTKFEIENAIREIVKVDHLFKASSKDSKYLFFVLLSNIMKKDVPKKNR